MVWREACHALTWNHYYSAPNNRLGRKAQTVPTIPSSANAVIKAKSKSFLFQDRSSPNMRRWKQQGNTTHTNEQARLPTRDMIRSNDGTNIAIATKTPVMTARTVIRRRCRSIGDRGLFPRYVAELRGSSPAKTSMVEYIGRAFSGHLVRGLFRANQHEFCHQEETIVRGSPGLHYSNGNHYCHRQPSWVPVC